MKRNLQMSSMKRNFTLRNLRRLQGGVNYLTEGSVVVEHPQVVFPSINGLAVRTWRPLGLTHQVAYQSFADSARRSLWPPARGTCSTYFPFTVSPSTFRVAATLPIFPESESSATTRTV